MECQTVDPLLYDRLTGRLNEADSQAVDTHVALCAGCRDKFERLGRTVASLDTWTVPDPSPDFHDRLLASVAAHLQAIPPRAETPTKQVSAPKILRPRPGRRGLASIPRRQWLPFGGLAVAATLLGVVVLYQVFGPGERQPEQMTRGLQLDLSSTPIIIETLDQDKTLADLVAIIRAHGGQLLRTQPVASGLELTVKIAQQDEQQLLRGLKSLGRVSVPKEGYRDVEGNLLVLLKKEGTFVP